MVKIVRLFFFLQELHASISSLSILCACWYFLFQDQEEAAGQGGKRKPTSNNQEQV